MDFSDSSEDLVIHVWVRLLGRRQVTTIENLHELGLDLKKIAKYMGKTFNCGKSVKDNVISLQGDQRGKVEVFLIQENIVTADQIKVHGCYTTERPPTRGTEPPNSF